MQAIRSRFLLPSPCPRMLEEQLGEPEPAFELLEVEELLPEDVRALYAAAGR